MFLKRNKEMKKRYKPNHLFSMQFFTSCISTTLVLLLLGAVVFCVLTAQNLSVYVRENINISLLLNDDISKPDTYKLLQQLKHERYVRDVMYISKEEALKEQTEAMGSDPAEFLGHNPFTASMEVKLASDYANSDSLKWIEKNIKQNRNVVEIVDQQDLMDAVNTNVRRASIIMLCLAALLSLISFALINNTIRLSIYSQRFSIYTMKLVGASWGFIRKPYVMRNLWIGIVSGLLADGVLMFAAYMMVTYEPELLEVVTLDVMIIVLSSVFLFGLIITFLCAYFSVNKYLRMKASALY